MKKILIVILAGKETHEGMGRLTNVLVLAKEMKESGYGVKVIFDGAGTEWIPEITNKESKFFQLYNEVKDLISGACDFCAAAFKVKNEIFAVKLLHEHMGHPSFKMSKIFHPVYDWWLEAKCACKLKKIFEHAQKPPIKYMHI